MWQAARRVCPVVSTARGEIKLETKACEAAPLLPNLHDYSQR
ncbi:hypothetical protein B0G81_3333 [Paraburkholderia sp. BL6665CI2N2]|nr:hypothetical protein B0G81_3333 [Paraburkholderia sp. BL6665CI2N2]